MGILDRLRASSLQPRIQGGMKKACNARSVFFFGADPGDSNNDDISVASWMHNKHVHGRGWKIPPGSWEREYGKHKQA